MKSISRNQSINRTINQRAKMASSTNSIYHLLATVKGNDLVLVKKILQSGVNPNINRDQPYWLIPLLLAVSNGPLEIIKCLLQFRADIEIADCDGATVLHYAAAYGRSNVVELLISHNADVNKQRTSDRWTAFQSACCSGQAICVSSLLERGADVALKDKYGKTGRDVAVDMKKSDVVKLLDDFVKSDAIAKNQLKEPQRSVSDNVTCMNATCVSKVEQTLQAYQSGLRGLMVKNSSRECVMTS